MSHQDDQEPKRGGRQSQEPSPKRDTPPEERTKKEPGQTDEKEEEPKRPTRVRYEADDEPPLSGGTSQILTR